MAEERILLVTNRAPVSFRTEGGQLRVSRGAGGVVTALRHLVRTVPVTWIAAAASQGDLLVARDQREYGGLLGRGRLTLRLVSIPPDVFADYYGEFSNRILWFVQHALWERRVRPEGPERIRELAERYAQANRVFADAVTHEMHRPGQAAVVLMHDYQLYPLPALVRGRMAGARIAHFVHIPWPAPETWTAAMPADVVARIARGLLGADVVHFQTRASLEAFAATAELAGAKAGAERIELGGRATLLRVRPVSVDPAALRVRPEALARVRSDGRRLIVRVDRADPIKNVPTGFLAFERLLERRPDLAGQVRFVARVVPSRSSLPEYARELDLTRRLAVGLNERFGPGTVDLIERQDRGRALAELAAADVVLVNSVADGMNLVAKEAAVINPRAVLVLSRTAGAYEELGADALGVDAADTGGTALALERALEMPEDERRTRAANMRRRVMAWTSRHWLRAQLDDLEEAAPSRPVAAG